MVGWAITGIHSMRSENFGLIEHPMGFPSMNATEQIITLGCTNASEPYFCSVVRELLSAIESS